MRKRLPVALVVLLAWGCTDKSTRGKDADADTDVSGDTDTSVPSATPPPSLSSSTQYILPGQSADIAVVATDFDVQSVTWSVDGALALAAQGASGATVTAQTTSVSGDASVVIAVITGTDAMSAPKTYTAQLILTTRATVQDDVFTTTCDTVLDTTAATGLLANDLGAMSTSVNAAVATPPQHGTVIVGWQGDFAYRPDAGYVGDDVFTYTLTERSGLTSTASVTVTVNDALIARDDVIAVSGTGARSWFTTDQLTANDLVPNGAVTMTLGSPTGFTLTPVSDPLALPIPGLVLDTPVATKINPDAFFHQDLAYKVTAAAPGTYLLPYTITDETGATSSAIATIVVMAANPLGEDSPATMDTLTVGTLTLGRAGTAWFAPTSLETINGFTGTMYHKTADGRRDAAIVSFTQEVLAPRGEVYFVPQPFKFSAHLEDPQPYNVFSTLIYSVRDAFESAEAKTLEIVVFGSDDPP